jgi:hypothetical protein
MSQLPEDADRQAGGELVIPAMAVAFTLYFIWTILDSPWTAQVSAFLIGGVLLALCLLFFAKTALGVLRGRATLGFANLYSIEDFRSGRVVLLCTTLGYVVLIDWLGFTLTTFLFLTLSMAALSRGKRLGLIAVVAAAMSLGGWALFIWAFETRFPRGFFEDIMAAALTNG